MWYLVSVPSVLPLLICATSIHKAKSLAIKVFVKNNVPYHYNEILVKEYHEQR